jgi:hypothetical protein
VNLQPPTGSSYGTAVYGPLRTVVWEEGSRKTFHYPDICILFGWCRSPFFAFRSMKMLQDSMMSALVVVYNLNISSCDDDMAEDG